MFPYEQIRVNSQGFIPEFDQFQAVVINNVQVYLKWGVNESSGALYDINDYLFYIQRSHSEIEQFEEVSEALVGVTVWLDEPPSLLSKWRKIFYKLRVVHPASGEELILGPISIHEHSMPTAHCIAMIKRHNMYLSRFPVGSLVYAYIQRQWGSRCRCWNVVRGRSDNDKCTLCLGTGWMYPYNETPIRLYVNLNPDVEITQIADFEIERDERQGWCGNFPDFKRRDVILVPGKNNSMYRIENKKWIAQERSEIGIVQAIHLIPFAPTDPEASILNLSNNVNEIEQYMDIVWANSRKTYFGCRSGLPSIEISREHPTIKTYR